MQGFSMFLSFLFCHIFPLVASFFAIMQHEMQHEFYSANHHSGPLFPSGSFSGSSRLQDPAGTSRYGRLKPAFLFGSQSYAFCCNIISKYTIMLYKNHGWCELFYQIFNLHSRINVNIVKRFIPHI